jgi:hypothetical protein
MPLPLSKIVISLRLRVTMGERRQYRAHFPRAETFTQGRTLSTPAARVKRTLNHYNYAGAGGQFGG